MRASLQAHFPRLFGDPHPPNKRYIVHFVCFTLLFFIFCTLLFFLFQVSCLLVCAVEYVANGFNISCIQVLFVQSSKWNEVHKMLVYKFLGIFMSVVWECLFFGIYFSEIDQAGIPDYWPIPAHVMNTYCYIMSTFTLPRCPPTPCPPSSIPSTGTSLARLISQSTQGWASTMGGMKRLWTM